MTQSISAGKKKMPNKDEFINHPDFVAKMAEEMKDFIFPADKIPEDFDVWLNACLFDIPLSNLIELTGMNKMQYDALVTMAPESMAIGMLMKAVDIVYKARPSELVQIGDYVKYSSIIAQCIDLKKYIEDIITPIRNRVLEQLMREESIKGFEQKVKA